MTMNSITRIIYKYAKFQGPSAAVQKGIPGPVHRCTLNQLNKTAAN